MSRRSFAGVFFVTAVALSVLAGCAKTARERPVKMGDVNTGAGSLEAVRRQLQGSWELVSLAVVPQGGGEPVPLKARGTLTYDEYGNLTIDAHTDDPNAPQAARSAGVLSFKGRAVIDAPKSELKLMDVTGNVNPDEVLSIDRRRKYEFAAGTLKLSSIDEQRRPSAPTAKWFSVLMPTYVSAALRSSFV